MTKNARPKKKVGWSIFAEEIGFLETRLVEEGVNSVSTLVNIILTRYRNQFNKNKS